jgi:hypothetical protein
MSREISVTKTGPHAANIEQLSAKRSWMDETYDKHAYMCFPVSLTNRLGWGISYPKDIRLVWDGITDTTDTHIKVLEGEEYVYTGRGNATISFISGLIFKTDPETTLLTMPVPNQFIRGAQCYTTLISTSFYMPELPLGWRMTEPNIEVVIPAGTPVAAVLPMSLTALENDYELVMQKEYPTQEYWAEVRKYGDAAEIKNGVGDWSKMYREALDYTGTSVGKHETKSIRLKTITCPVTGMTINAPDN